MEFQYDFGMIGLGVMGSNLLLNMADHGFSTIGFDLKPEKTKAFEDAARPGTVVKGINTLTEMVSLLKTPRKIMMLVPAGKPVDDVIASLLPIIEQGDILIDGGNSYFKDTTRRIAFLRERGIHFMGMGISGGEAGARLGPSMMPGGDEEAFVAVTPMLEAVAARADGLPCFAYMGTGAAGHYVKMVHNGIEYAMMQMISEVYDLLKRGGGFNNDELHQAFDKWNKGQLQSFLIDITASIFTTKDVETKNYLVDMILDQAGSKGTGKWTSQEAADLPIPIPSIDAAVSARNISVYKQERQKAYGLYKPEITNMHGAGETLLADAENTLAFCFIIAYAQGLSMLAKASVELELNIPLPSVIQVWKAGCIIRSALLGNFTSAFAAEPNLPNLLLDHNIAALIKEREESVRKFIGLAVNLKVPVPSIMSSLAYFDSYSSEKLPTNLIQAQRDFFGAHTYQRTDKSGVFHTEWEA